jgi:hypothetical protein
MYSTDAYDVSVPMQVKKTDMSPAEMAEHQRHMIFRQESAQHAREGGLGWVPGVDPSDVCVHGPGGNHLRQGIHCPHASTQEELDTVTVITL